MEKRIKAIETEQNTLRIEIENVVVMLNQFDKDVKKMLTQFDVEVKRLRTDLKGVTTVLKRKLD